MKIFLTVALLASTATAYAEDIHANSHIDAVTVFPQGADVIRITEAKLGAGEHTLILDDLPGNIDTQSIRVEGVGGQGLEISAIDSKLIEQTSDAMNQEHQKLNDAIEALGDERAVLDQVIADADYQRKLLLSLADKQLLPTSATETVKAIDTVQLGGLVDLIEVRLALISKTIHNAQLRQRKIDREVGDLQLKQSALSPDVRSHVQVMVHVAAAAAMNGQFKLSYRVQEASWVPFYDARMSIADAKLNIVRRAEVTQTTGESWDNVTVKLSTARPLGATAAPELGEVALQISSESLLKYKQETDNVAAAPAMEAQAVSDGVIKSDVPAIQRQAVLELAGYNANYVISGRTSIDNTGTAKKVRIGTDDFVAKLQALTVPRLDLTAYLTAGFKLNGDGAMLPGVLNLYRDGIYVGQGNLPLIAAGEEAKLGFGADDMIKVKRAEVKRNSGEEGILTSSNVQEMAWDISVTNLHDMVIPVTVIDRAPYSTQTDVTVEPMATATPPTINDYEKRRGVLAWNFTLEPKAEKQIKTGYKITSPKAVHISLSE
jgi:uncharacterized protein (TIGR02231 family)